MYNTSQLAYAAAGILPPVTQLYLRDELSFVRLHEDVPTTSSAKQSSLSASAMDPLTAFSLASSVIQVVDFTTRIIGGALKISKAGLTGTNIEVAEQTRLLREFHERLSPDVVGSQLSELSQDDRNLFELCKQSKIISGDLLKILDNCKSVDGNSIWHAIKSEWNDSKLKDLQARLDRIDSRAHTLLSVNYFAQILERLSNLETVFNVLGTPRRSELQGIEKAIQEVSENVKGVSSSTTVSRQLVLNAAEDGGLSKFAVEASILEQLRFGDIDRRLFELERRPAHASSYHWLEDRNKNKEQARFNSWLTSSEKLYWISGKPGSGKSTLMKYLYQRPETRSQLQAWTSGSPVLLAAYFFWEVGKIELLRTQEGLLRTLLFQILRQQPSLIRKVYGELWLFKEDTAGHQNPLSGFSGFQVSTAVQDLIQRMKLACQSLGQSGTKLCLFIDGLDEYSGKPDDIVQLMDIFCSMSDVKVCVASRPDNAFLEAYGHRLFRLYVEDFNATDMTNYVRDTLENNQHYKMLEDKDTLGGDLIKDLVRDSGGVFLWVRLVLEELKEGLRNKDTIADLQRRLMRLPKDLEYFFMHMLRNIDEFYYEQSATMFLVTLHANDMLPAICCWFISEGTAELDKVHEVKTTDFRRNNKRREVISARLNTYCKGLLEIQHISLGSNAESLPSSTLFSQRVNFLHRTVRDFLLSNEPMEMLDSWKPGHFDTDEVICKALLAQISTSPSEQEYFEAGGPIANLKDIFNEHNARLRIQPSKSALAESLSRSLEVAMRLRARPGSQYLLNSLAKQNEQAVTGSAACSAVDRSVRFNQTQAYSTKKAQSFRWRDRFLKRLGFR